MTSKAEQTVSRSLRAVLAGLANGASIGDSEQLREVLSGLECFLPEVLGEIHPEWEEESLDGVLPTMARKSGEGEAEVFGLCIIISDQTLTPVHLRLQVATTTDEVSWLECEFGERQGQRLVRTPYDSLSASMKRLYLLEGQVDRIEWFYKVTFGNRRP